MIHAHTLIEIVCRQSNTSAKDLKTRCRKPKYYIPRFACYELLQVHCKLDNSRIAELFDVSPYTIRESLLSLNRKRKSRYRDSYADRLIELIEECNRIINIK